MQKTIKDFMHFYLGCEMICHQDFQPNKKESHPKGKGFCHLTADLLSDIHANRQEYGTPYFKLLLRKFEDITEEEWQQAWVVIGGTPHLYEHGKEEFQQCLLEGYWDESGIQMDYYTMTALINYFRGIGIDCDDLIDSKNAAYKIEYEKSNS
jgi:hypothetical protein